MDRPKRSPRIKGRKAVALRRQRLRDEPLCRDCLELRGLFVPATVPDHIKPLAHGGTEDPENIRCLCAECHRKRTAEQFGKKPRPRFGPDGWPEE